MRISHTPHPGRAGYPGFVSKANSCGGGVCASLGEFYEFNEDNFVQLNNGKDQSTNVKLQFTLHENDSKLWDVMDEATYQTIEVMSGGETSNIEYWDVHKGKWVKERQPKEAIRIPGIVHESSTAFVGPRDEGGSLDETYRPHGVKNVVCVLSVLTHFVWPYSFPPPAFSANPFSVVCDGRRYLPVRGELEPHVNYVRIRAGFG